MTNIIGIVRFSVLSTKPSPFKAYKDRTFDEIATIILNDQRLARRFHLFETICLPSLDAQTDQDFVLYIVAPQLLPEHWKARLSQLEAGRKYLRVHYADHTDFTMADISEGVFDLIDQQIFYTFRLDDDDALTCDFISRIRKSLRDSFVGHAMSHCRGYYLDMGEAGYRIRHELVPNIATGFGFISSLQKPRTIFDVSEHHHRFHKWCPVITDARRPTFLATTHDANDTGDQRRLDSETITAPEAAKRLRRTGFNIELELFEKLRISGFDQNTPVEHNLREFRSDVREDIYTGLRSLSAQTQHEIDEELASRNARHLPV